MPYEMLYGLPPFYSRNMQEMYTSIINSPLIFKRHATADAKDLLIGLLQKNPEKRLGTGHEDFDEIKKHVFFQSINWDDLLNKRIEPPFKPQVANETDLSMIDRTFRDEPLPNSVIDPITATYVEKHQLNRGEEFVGFSYVRPSASEFFDEDTTYVQ